MAIDSDAETNGEMGEAGSDLGTRLERTRGRPPCAGSIEAFRRAVVEHYRGHGRDLPWRRTRDPYAILVSEVMLQQTQVPRVIPKYEEFLASFPTVLDLARATIAEVLCVWQGLGYNRRALALQKAAQSIVTDHSGLVPDSPALLRALPGIGPATAAAVCVFSYDRPLVFIETNIRAAYIHFFFQECVSIPDAAILPLVDPRQTVPGMSLNPHRHGVDTHHGEAPDGRHSHGRRHAPSRSLTCSRLQGRP